MATSITKSGTNIAETSQEEALKLSALSEKAGVVPSTPAGAVSIGANQDQAKMARTPATKPTRIDGAKPTLQEAERLTPKAAPGTTAPEKLERMRQLGALNTQVEGLVEGYMQQLQSQQAALSLNTTTLGLVEEGKRPALETALNKYKTALTEAEKEAAVIEAGNALGRPLTQAEMVSYFAGAPDALSGLAKNVTPESISLSDLNLASSGVNLPQLAADLGVSEDELAGLTLPQLNAKIEEMRQSEFAAGDAAQAEALSAVGNRAKQLASERQALGQSGVVGYEDQFQRMQTDIEQAQNIRVAGQDMTIDKLLQDEELSKIIADASISESALKRLEQTEPALASWVREYRTALAQLSSDAGLVAQDVVATQQQANELKKDVSSELFTQLFGERPDIMSQSDLQQLQADMQGSALWSALSSDSDLRSRLEISPSAVEALKSLSAEDIKTVMDATKAAEANPVLADLMGWEPGGVLTPAQTDFVNTWRDEIASLPPAIASDKSFQDMVKQGQLNEAAVSLLANDPTLWDDVRAEQAAQQELSRVDNEQEFLDVLTGDGAFTLDSFNEAMDNLKAWAATGDQKALSYYTQLSKALTGPDGKLDLADVQKALQEMQAAGAAPSDVIEGGAGVSKLLRQLGTTLREGGAYYDKEASTKQVVLKYLKNDQRIDANELNEIYKQNGGSFIKSLLDEPWLPNRQELADAYNAQIRSEASKGLTPFFDKLKGLMAIGNLRVNGSNVTFDIDPASLSKDVQNFPTYRAQIKDVIAKLGEYYEQSADDGSFASTINSLQGKLKQLDQLATKEGVSAIQKEMFPKAGPDFANNILNNLALVEKFAAPGSRISEPGLDPAEILRRFKLAYNGKSALDINNAIARELYSGFRT